LLDGPLSMHATVGIEARSINGTRGNEPLLVWQRCDIAASY
jgi:hypothetical protein